MSGSQDTKNTGRSTWGKEQWLIETTARYLIENPQGEVYVQSVSEEQAKRIYAEAKRLVEERSGG